MKYSTLLGSTKVGEPDGNHFEKNIQSGLWEEFKEFILKRYTNFEQI